MVSAFGKGVLLGIGESVEESLDQASKAFQEKTGRIIDYHLQQGQAEKLRHKKQQRETEEVLQTLSTLTGESDPEKAFNRAGQILTSLGGDLAQAKEVAQQIRKARSIDPNFELSNAIKFVENKDIPIQSRGNIIESFATGSRGRYTPDVAPMTPEGILGKIVGEKDIQSKVSSQLSAMGIQPETEEGRIARPVSAKIDYRIIDPEGAVKFQTAQEQQKGLKLTNSISQQRIDMGVFNLKEAEARSKALPKTIQNELDMASAKIANLNLTNEQLQVTLNLSKTYDAEKYMLRNEKLKTDLVRARSGSSIDAAQVFLETESQILKTEMEELIEAGVASQSQLDTLQMKLDNNEETRVQLGELSGKGTNLFSKESASSIFKHLLAANAESLGVGYTKEGVGEAMDVTLQGNGYDVHRVYQKTIASYRAQYNQFEAARLFANAMEQAPVANLDKYINENIHKATSIESDLLKTENTETGALIFDEKKLKRGTIYDLRGNKRLVNMYKKHFIMNNNFAFAIWDGKKFLGVTKPKKKE